jgi:ABC-type amino acid transport substrate-binding protein/ABC-type amino acid transport system permease subunit
MKSWLSLLFVLIVPLWSTASKATEVPYARAAETIIAESRAKGCLLPDSTLAELLCRQTLRLGVRTNYRLFSEAAGKEFKGFEIDLANVIAKRLGVRAEFVGVTASDRIEKLLDRHVDVVLATMAHTVTRDAIIHFIRPHYYSSPTTVVGAKGANIRDWEDLSGKAVCVPLGNFSNIVFSANRVRLLIYDRPDRMIDALRLGACGMIAHDRSLLQPNVFGATAPKELSDRFEEKLSFNEVPWGIGVRKEAKDDLGAVLSLIMADLHQSGDLQKLAREHHLDIDFLSAKKVLLSQPTCLINHRIAEKCLGTPAELSDTPTAIAPSVNVFEKWLNTHTGLSLKFPMLVGQSAARLFVVGIIASLLIVVGSIMATIGFAFLFFQLLRSRLLVIRMVTNIMVQFFQNSPIILLLVLGYLVITFITTYEPILAVLVSILVIGLNNGANGGSAMNETGMVSEPESTVLMIAKNTSIQLRAAVINAAKASPVAAFIGAPELLAVLTDITSFSGERVTTYLILSIFYLVLVQTVVIVSLRLTDRLKRNG